jgi:hypothetical protein
MGRKVVDNLVMRTEIQIEGGDIHENQGYELQPTLDKWINAYDKYLTYQEKCDLRQYFFDRIKAIDSSRRKS